MTIQMDNHRLFAVFEEADRLMKESNGHSFETIMKTECIYCHKSPKVKTKCGGWFQTFLRKVEYIMLNPESEEFKHLGITLVKDPV